MADARWTARSLGGGIYCSPRCGFNCTQAAHDRAVKEAGELVAALGDGWSSKVWENCGWRYAAYNGAVSITPITRGSAISGVYEVTGYSAILSSSVCGQDLVTAADPVEAFGLTMQQARTRLSRFESELNEISNGQRQDPDQ